MTVGPVLVTTKRDGEVISQLALGTLDLALRYAGSLPSIVTVDHALDTPRPCGGCPGDEGDGLGCAREDCNRPRYWAGHAQSDEARRLVWARRAFPGEGGSTTLPAGAEITLERTTWAALIGAVGWGVDGTVILRRFIDDGQLTARGRRHILDRFNSFSRAMIGRSYGTQ